VTPIAPDHEPTITCAVLAWNEVATLRSVVEELRPALRDLKVSYEILVIDDGSTDGSSEVADALAAESDDVRVVHHGENRGLGGAYRTGFREARGTYLTFFPADGQFPGSILPSFYPLIERYDMVLGNLPARRDSFRGRVLTRAERLVYRVIFGAMPRLEGVFMMRRSMLAELPLKSEGRGWVNVMELLIRAARGGYRLVGVPTVLRPRSSGTSKVNNLRTIRANVEQLVKLRRRL
jgi:glycosyltransferase involved in cell wall biosynthesis